MLRGASLRFPTAVAAFALLACSVDDRVLTPVVDGTGGSSTAEPNDNAGAETNGGAAGANVGPSDLVDGCADLDTDGVADCTVTIVQNPSFTSDVSGWSAAGASSWAWDPKNALDDTPSGSGKLTAAMPRASATQCVPISGKKLVITYANVFVQAADDGTSPSQAEVAVSFFPTADCSGASDTYFETPPSSVSGQWATVQAGGQPNKDQSISVALTALKAADATDVTVYFDNVMVKELATK